MFQIDVQGDTKLITAFDRFGSLAKDFRPVWNSIADDFYEMEERLFSSAGSSGGVRWASLQPSTLQRKPAGLGILVRSGKLRSSLTGGPGGVKKISSTQMTIGTRHAAAGFHFYGTRKMAKRQPIAVTPEDKRRWLKIQQRELISLAKEAGLTSYSGGS